MNQEIIEYLERAEHDFNEGFALFCRYSRNESAMSWIGRRHDDEKLLYELEKLSQETAKVNPIQAANVARFNRNLAPSQLPPVQAPAAAPSAPEIRFRTYDDRRTRRSDLPEDLQKVYDSISEDYKLRRGLHEKMKQSTTDKDRASLRAKIIETNDMIRGKFAEIDGYLAKQAAEAEKAKADDFKESTARSYISKALKKENLSGAQKATIKARYEALLSHGCTVGDDLTNQLKKRNLI